MRVAPDLLGQFAVATGDDVGQRAAYRANAHGNRFNGQKPHIAGRDADSDAGLLDVVLSAHRLRHRSDY